MRWHHRQLFDPAVEGSAKGGGVDETEESTEGGGRDSDGQSSDSGGWDDLKPFLKEGKLVVQVNGKERALGPAEVKAELQKGFAGSAQLEAAAAHRAETEGNLQYAQDFEAAIGDGDREAFFRLAEAKGISQEEAENLLSQFEEEPEGTEELGAKPEVQYVERPVSAAEKDQDQWVRKQRLKQVREEIHANVDVGVDTDPRFATIMKAGGSKADELRQLAKNNVKRIVVSEGADYSEAVRGQALDEVAHFLDIFGSVDGTPLPPGAGPAPFGGVAAVVPLPEQRMKRPDPAHPDYEKWVVQQMLVADSEALA